MGVPYLVADVGGLSELVRLEAFSEAVLPEPSAPQLAAHLQSVLERGTLPLLPLRPQVPIPSLLCAPRANTHQTCSDGLCCTLQHEACSLHVCLAARSSCAGQLAGPRGSARGLDEPASGALTHPSLLDISAPGVTSEWVGVLGAVQALTGAQQWVDWHRNFEAERPALSQVSAPKKPHHSGLSVHAMKPCEVCAPLTSPTFTTNAGTSCASRTGIEATGRLLQRERGGWLCGALQADAAAVAQVGAAARVRVVGVARGDAAMRVWQAACGGASTADLDAPMLLLPDGFSLLQGDGVLQVHILLRSRTW